MVHDLRLLGYAHDLLRINLFICPGIVGQARTIGDMPRSKGSLLLQYAIQSVLAFCILLIVRHTPETHETHMRHT